MNRFVMFAAVTLALAGCDNPLSLGRPSGPRALKPDEQSAVSLAREVSSASPTSAPASAPSPTAAPAYRVLGEPQVVAAAMIQVNDLFITVEDILRPLHSKLKALGATSSEPEFRAQGLDWIRRETQDQLEQSLFLSEADARLDDQDKKRIDDEIQDQLREAVALAGGSRLKLDADLRAEGTDLTAWEQGQRRLLTIRIYTHRRFGEQVGVNRQMLWDYYTAHRDQFVSPETLQMQIVAALVRSFLPAERSGPAAMDAARVKAREQIDKAAAALAGVQPFDAVAREFSSDAMKSSGGVWPVMARGAFRAKAVEQAAWDQNEGSVSTIIETVDGFYIVKTLAKTAQSELPFEQVQGKIEDVLREQQYAQLTRKYLEKIQSQTVVHRPAGFEENALDVAVKRYCRPPVAASRSAM